MLPSHSPCTPEKQTHLSREQHIRQANLACVTACLQGKNIPEQEHSRTHLAVYHPRASLQSFLCTAGCRSSDNPGLGSSSSDVLSLMLPLNPRGGGGGGGREAALLCGASPRMRESCQQAAPGSCRQETAKGSKGLLPGTEKSPFGCTGLHLHTPSSESSICRVEYLRVVKKVGCCHQDGYLLHSKHSKPKIMSRNDNRTAAPAGELRAGQELHKHSCFLAQAGFPQRSRVHKKLFSYSRKGTSRWILLL